MYHTVYRSETPSACSHVSSTGAKSLPVHILFFSLFSHGL
jgi:hypothetical protein